MLKWLLPDNPVLTKELRVRMRGARAYWILFGYLGFLSCVLLGGYYSWQSAVHSEGAGSSAIAEFGGGIYSALIITQMFLVLFITPAITSGSLTIEKEQRTLEMLTMTRMPRRSIIVGKLLSAVLFTSLLLISSLPLISICFMLGSIDPVMVVSTYLELLFGSLLIASLGLMWSSIAKSTTLAVLFTYSSMSVIFLIGASAYGTTRVPFGVSNPLQAAVTAVADPMFGSAYMGIKCPEGVGFAVVALLAGLLMSAIAMSRLETFPERRAGLLRCLTALLVGLVCLAADIWWLNAWYHRGGQAVMSVAVPPIGVLMVTAALLMLLVPAFATGDLSPYDARRYLSYLRSGWTRSGLSRGKVSSGTPFLILLTLLLLMIHACAFVLVGKQADIVHSAAQTLPVAQAPSIPVTKPSLTTPSGYVMVNGQKQQWAMVNGTMTLVPVTSVAPLAPLPPGYQNRIGDFPQAAVMIVAFVVGFSLLCLLLSVVFRNRWVAWIAAMAVLIILWMAPEQGRVPTFSGMPPEPTVALYYLNPEQALLQMSDPVQFRTYNKALAMADQAMWRLVTQAWLTVGLISLLASIPLARRQGRVVTEIPYEAMVAEA